MTLQTIAICLFAAWCVITIGAVLLAKHLDRTRDEEIRRRNLARRIGGKERQIDTTGYRLGRGAHPITDAGPKPKTAPQRTDWDGEAQG